MVLVNAVPVMVDIDPLTCNISPEAIEATIMPRTRAVILVHYGGYLADMDAVMEIADKHGLWAIEDCAHTHGSQWRGKGVGLIGHLGMFSFQIGKTLTCGKGGMVLTNDDGFIGHLGMFSFQIGKTLTCGKGGMVLTNDETHAENTACFVNWWV